MSEKPFPETSPLLFAYGSNLCPSRLRARVESARYLAPARLPGHVLRFHMMGRDGSGKADALPTGCREDEVWGVLFTLHPADKPALDAAEGPGYREVEVEVEVRKGGRIRARMYQAREGWRNAMLSPYRWYRNYVLSGAEHHGIPEAYLARIRDVAVADDPDRDRARLNRLRLSRSWTSGPPTRSSSRQESCP